jgi:carbon-monoxide dehydrogenase medium subunit
VVHEKSHTAGDFATVAVVAVLSVEDATVARARIGIAGAESRPVRATEAEGVLAGAPADPSAFEAAARTAAEHVSPTSDNLSSADYKQHLVELLIRRALRDAVQEVAA